MSRWGEGVRDRTEKYLYTVLRFLFAVRPGWEVQSDVFSLIFCGMRYVSSAALCLVRFIVCWACDLFSSSPIWLFSLCCSLFSIFGLFLGKYFSSGPEMSNRTPIICIAENAHLWVARYTEQNVNYAKFVKEKHNFSSYLCKLCFFAHRQEWYNNVPYVLPLWLFLRQDTITVKVMI